MYLIGGVNSEVVLDDLWRLNLDTWVWERINIFEKKPGALYGHSASLVENSIFIYTGDALGNKGELLKVPTVGLLWSLRVEEGSPEWSRYKVEGSIPPKRFHSSILVTNDIVIYGGGPDCNLYQLDRNDVPREAVSLDIFRDFIMPYASMVEKFEVGERDSEGRRGKGSSRNSDTGAEEEKAQLKGYSGGIEKKTTGSSAGSRADDVMHKARLVALSRKNRK